MTAATGRFLASWDTGRRRQAVLVVTGVVAVLTAWEFIDLWRTFGGRGEIGQDWVFYRQIGERWLETGRLYGDRQLTGADYHVLVNVDNLYPPPSILLFAPFALLPALLSALVWWLVPVGLVALVLVRCRPAAWTWPLLALCAFWPRTLGSLIVGNTDLWSAAFVAGGILWGWPAALGFFKPSLAPFALVGARRRSWWLALAAMIVVATLFLVRGAWADYLVAVTHWDLPWDRQLLNAPMLLVPIVAWLGRRDRSVSSRPSEGGTP